MGGMEEGSEGFLKRRGETEAVAEETTGELFQASFEASLIDSPFVASTVIEHDLNRIRADKSPEDILPAEEINNRYNLEIPTERDMSKEEAVYLETIAEQRERRLKIYSDSSGVGSALVGFGGMALAQVLDPINAALTFATAGMFRVATGLKTFLKYTPSKVLSPLIGTAEKVSAANIAGGKVISELGTKGQILTMFGENLVGNSAAEVIVYNKHRQNSIDYTTEEAVTNSVVGSMLGTSIGFSIKYGLGKWMQRRADLMGDDAHGNVHDKLQDDLKNDRKPDPDGVIELQDKQLNSTKHTPTYVPMSPDDTKGMGLLMVTKGDTEKFDVNGQRLDEDIGQALDATNDKDIALGTHAPEGSDQVGTIHQVETDPDFKSVHADDIPSKEHESIIKKHVIKPIKNDKGTGLRLTKMFKSNKTYAPDYVTPSSGQLSAKGKRFLQAKVIAWIHEGTTTKEVMKRLNKLHQKMVYGESMPSTKRVALVTSVLKAIKEGKEGAIVSKVVNETTKLRKKAVTEYKIDWMSKDSLATLINKIKDAIVAKKLAPDTLDKLMVDLKNAGVDGIITKVKNESGKTYDVLKILNPEKVKQKAKVTGDKTMVDGPTREEYKEKVDTYDESVDKAMDYNKQSLIDIENTPVIKVDLDATDAQIVKQTSDANDMINRLKSEKKWHPVLDEANRDAGRDHKIKESLIDDLTGCVLGVGGKLVE